MTTYSTVGLEAMMMKKPVIIFDIIKGKRTKKVYRPKTIYADTDAVIRVLLIDVHDMYE